MGKKNDFIFTDEKNREWRCTDFCGDDIKVYTTDNSLTGWISRSDYELLLKNPTIRVTPSWMLDF